METLTRSLRSAFKNTTFISETPAFDLGASSQYEKIERPHRSTNESQHNKDNSIMQMSKPGENSVVKGAEKAVARVITLGSSAPAASSAAPGTGGMNALIRGVEQIAIKAQEIAVSASESAISQITRFDSTSSRDVRQMGRWSSRLDESGEKIPSSCLQRRQMQDLSIESPFVFEQLKKMSTQAEISHKISKLDKVKKLDFKLEASEKSSNSLLQRSQEIITPDKIDKKVLAKLMEYYDKAQSGNSGSTDCMLEYLRAKFAIEQRMPDSKPIWQTLSLTGLENHSIVPGVKVLVPLFDDYGNIRFNLVEHEELLKLIAEKKLELVYLPPHRSASYFMGSAKYGATEGASGHFALKLPATATRPAFYFVLTKANSTIEHAFDFQNGNYLGQQDVPSIELMPRLITNCLGWNETSQNGVSRVMVLSDSAAQDKKIVTLNEGVFPHDATQKGLQNIIKAHSILLVRGL